MNREVKSPTGVSWHCASRIDKYSPNQVRWAQLKTGRTNLSGDELRAIVGEPEEMVYIDGNILTQNGAAYIWSLAVGVAYSPISNNALLSGTNVGFGVGDGNGSSPTVMATDTDLTATTNKYYNPIDGGYPTLGAIGPSAGVYTAQSTFGGGVANFSWNEWGMFGCPPPGPGIPSGVSVLPAYGVMINHKSIAAGIKSGGSSWTLITTLSLA